MSDVVSVPVTPTTSRFVPEGKLRLRVSERNKNHVRGRSQAAQARGAARGFSGPVCEAHLGAGSRKKINRESNYSKNCCKCYSEAKHLINLLPFFAENTCAKRRKLKGDRQI